MPQLLFDFENAERRSVLDLWRVDEIYSEAGVDLLQEFREDKRIERKLGGAHAELIAEYVCMWANTPPIGGLIVLGIEDNGDITGCSAHSQAITEIERRVRSDLVRDARFDTKRLMVRRTANNEADFITLVWVQHCEDKLVETNKGESFIRLGDSKSLSDKGR
jgi:ATP-dependent DNA helicase RecG